MLIVYVALSDDAVMACDDNGVPVTISIEGREAVGPATAKTEDGVASFVLRTGRSCSQKIKARAIGTEARKTLRLEK